MRYRILFLALVFTCHSAFANTQYVTDDFEIMFRSGPGSKNKILKVLRSGTKLEVIKQDAGNGHSEVQLSDGKVGYVLTRYMSSTPSSKARVASLEKQLQQLRAKPDQLQSMLAEKQDENKQLVEQNQKLNSQYRKAFAELENIKKVSSNAVQLAQDHDRLQGEVQQLLLQLDDARIKNQSLKDQSAKNWFMLGSATVIFGLFLGWVLSFAKPKRRQSWGGL